MALQAQVHNHGCNGTDCEANQGADLGVLDIEDLDCFAGCVQIDGWWAIEIADHTSHTPE
jgi:hypothetical protein